MKAVHRWKDERTQDFWSRAIRKSVALRRALTITVPLLTLFSFVAYIVLAHGLNIYYTASFWLLLVVIWTIPAVVFFLRQVLKRRAAAKRNTRLYEAEDDDVDSYTENESMLANEGIDPLAHRLNAHAHELEYNADGYVERKFIVTGWNGLGIAACVFGIISGLLGSASEFLMGEFLGGGMALLFLLAVIALLFVILYESIGIRSQRDTMQWRLRKSKKKEALTWAYSICAVFVGVVLVALTILTSLQCFVSLLNLYHYPPPGKLYSVDGSQKMHLHCNGTGSPTVLHLHGLEGQSYDWAWIRPQVSRITTSCSVDFPGHGWSDPPSCVRCSRTASMQADSLAALLKAAGIVDNVILVAAGEAVLAAQVYANNAQARNVCSVVCVDCVDPSVLPSGSQDNPPPGFWNLWRNLLPSGLGGIFAATNSLAQFRTYDDLPENIHPNYVQNELKQKFPEAVVREYQSLPQSVQQARNVGTFGHRPFVGLIAGLGLNAPGVASLSTNSSLIYVGDSPHDMEFDQRFSTVILAQISQLISLARMNGC